MSRVTCFAFVYHEDGMIDIATMDATPELVKERLLNLETLGVVLSVEKQEQIWKSISQLGKIVRVVVEPAEGGKEHGN